MNGDFLRKKIEYAGFQLVDVANNLGISQQNLQSKLKTSDVKVSFLEKLAEAINKNVYYFFEDDIKTKSEENINKENVNKKVNINVNKPNVQKILTNEPTEEKVEYIDNVPVYYKERFAYPEDYKGIPLIPIDAMAGFGSGEFQIMNYETSMYRVPEFEELNTDFMIKVKGSSMYPKYSSGDTVACKKLNLSNIFFQWNKVYVLDTEQGALIKRIKKGSDNEHILLVSENPNYEPFELHLSQVYAVAIVIGVIRME